MEAIGGAVPGDAHHGERRRGVLGGESGLVTELHTEVPGGGGIEGHLTGSDRAVTHFDVPPGCLGIGYLGLSVRPERAGPPDYRPVGQQE